MLGGREDDTNIVNSKSSLVGVVKRLIRDGAVMKEVVASVRETFVSLVKREKEADEARNNPQGRKASANVNSKATTPKAATAAVEASSQAILTSARSTISTIQGQFWRWSVEVTSIAMAGSSSDASSLRDALLHLLGKATDRTNRCMRLPVDFPTMVPVPEGYEVGQQQQDSSDSDDSSSSSSSDSSDNSNNSSNSSNSKKRGRKGREPKVLYTLEEQSCKVSEQNYQFPSEITIHGYIHY